MFLKHLTMLWAQEKGPHEMMPGFARKDLTLKLVLISFGYTLIFNSIIGIFLNSLNIGDSFSHNFWFSQCVGLSICSFVLFSFYLIAPETRLGHMLTVALGVSVGVTVGVLVGGYVTNDYHMVPVEGALISFFRVAFVALLFGVVISYFFISKEHMRLSKMAADQERIKRLTTEKQMAQTRLSLLQAQIEPHFLFNTLANVRSLMESDPEKAKETLEDFISYLRSSLPKTRSSLNTLREEMELIRSYLKIFKVRMGPRLEFEINLPEELNGVLLPPMLLQPLVENALKHGLEPKEKGGGIKVSAARQGDKLVLKVSDTGLGLGVAKSPEKGLGLSNVRNRLAALYEYKASLILLENQPQGLEAVLEVPLAEDDGHNS